MNSSAPQRATTSGSRRCFPGEALQLVEAASAATEEEPTAVRAETHPGTVLGTFSYMSPEQARGGNVDARSDIFSFGIVLFQMLTGELPFQGETSADTLGAILKDPTPRVDSDKGGAALQPILEKCFQKSSTERYGSARELLQDLPHARTKFTSKSSLEQRLAAVAR